MAAKREDRRPQLVRGVGDELASRPFQRRQLLAHAVEGTGQLPELVGARVHHRLVEAPTGDSVRRPFEVMDPPREDAARAEADSESGCKQRDQAGDDEAFAHKRDVLEGVVDRR